MRLLRIATYTLILSLTPGMAHSFRGVASAADGARPKILAIAEDEDGAGERVVLEGFLAWSITRR